MIKLNFDDIIIFHNQSINMYGGIDGIRDCGRIESAINGMYQTVFGEDIYPELSDKAAHLANEIIMGHPFLDGNKRTGMSAMLSYLQLNGFNVQATNEEVIEVGLAVAQSKMNKSQLKSWIESHKQVKSKGVADNKPSGLGE